MHQLLSRWFEKRKTKQVDDPLELQMAFHFGYRRHVKLFLSQEAFQSLHSFSQSHLMLMTSHWRERACLTMAEPGRKQGRQTLVDQASSYYITTTTHLRSHYLPQRALSWLIVCTSDDLKRSQASEWVISSRPSNWGEKGSLSPSVPCLFFLVSISRYQPGGLLNRALLINPS